MGKRLAGVVAVLVVALAMRAGPAGAVREARAPKFVGTYRATLTLHGRTVFRKVTFDVNADGTFQAVGVGTWSNEGQRVTFINACCQDVFPGELDGRKTVEGINSRRHPGRWYAHAKGNDDHPTGTWYATKQSG